MEYIECAQYTVHSIPHIQCQLPNTHVLYDAYKQKSMTKMAWTRKEHLPRSINIRFIYFYNEMTFNRQMLVLLLRKADLFRKFCSLNSATITKHNVTIKLRFCIFVCDVRCTMCDVRALLLLLLLVILCYVVIILVCIVCVVLQFHMIRIPSHRNRK